MAKSLKKCIETLTKSGELSQDLASDIQSAVTSLVAEGYTAKDAAVAAINDALSDLRAELADVEKQVTDGSAGMALPKRGDRFKDGQGKEWEIWNARSSLIEAFPVVDGKIRVNNQDGQRFATDDRAKFANPEARTDYFPVPKAKAIVTPQTLMGNPENYIKVAADSIKELRKVDVYRVLVESNRAEFRLALADYIKSERPDLADEVDAVLAEQAQEPATQAIDYKGFRRVEGDAGTFYLEDGNMRVKVEPQGSGKFQASFRGAKSSPHIHGEQGAVDWADAYREDGKVGATATAKESSAPKPVNDLFPSSNTEDAGDELKYNKRNRVVSLNWDDIKDQDAALKVKQVVKSKVLEKPDYQAMIDGGMQPLIAHIVKQVYDGLAAKPQTRNAPTDEQLQLYIDGMNRVMDSAMAWAESNDSIDWLKKMGESASVQRAAITGSRIDLSAMASGKAEFKKLLEHIYPEGWKEYRAELTVIGGNRAIRAMQPGLDETIKALKEIEKGWPGKREAWQVQGYSIKKIVPQLIATTYYEGKTTKGDPYVSVRMVAAEGRQSLVLYSDAVDGAEKQTDSEVQKVVKQVKDSVADKFVLFDNRNRMVAAYETEEQAKEGAREKVKRTGGGGIREEGISVQAARRVGEARREEGENITSDKLMQTFGFRGVNFGNWMKGKSNEAERQLHLNHAYDAFLDLAEILGVPPKAMSLNGMLGLAIGAQGNGTAAAHFVPGLNEINITRTAGAGAVAHEWGHALDHYFARLAGLERETEPFLTEHAGYSNVISRIEVVDGKQKSVSGERFGKALRPEVLAKFKAIVEAMNKRQLTQDEIAERKKNNLESAKKNVDRWLDSIRRDYLAPHLNGKITAQEFDAIATRIRNMDLGTGEKVKLSKWNYITPVVAELRALYKTKTGYTYSADNLKALQSWMDSIEYATKSAQEDVDHKPQTTSTTYAANASKLDRDKGGKKYWSTDLEKFARAFDAFVFDQLKDRAAKNTYLAGLNNDIDTSPMGEERKTINAAFKDLVDTIETRETDSGVEFYSIEPRQTKAVDINSPEFKRWFGDSKVVDADGKPLVVYHGTDQDFDAFSFKWFGRTDAGARGKGFYFSEDSDYASRVAESAAASGIGEANVIPVYLRAESPYEWDGEVNNKGMSAEGFAAWLESNGYDSVHNAKTGEWVVLSPTQIKSAISNTGQFDPENSSILEDVSADRESAITRAIDRAIAMEQGKEVAPLRRLMVRNRLGKLRADLESGKIEDGAFIFDVNQLHRQMEDAYQVRQLAPHKGRERGADWIRQKLLEAKRRGDISEQAADMAEWFVLQNPSLVDDLGISLRTRKDGAASGNYNPMNRVMTLFKGEASDTTAVHEILHHLERMMPAEMQEQIRLEWIKQVTKELSKAIKAKDQKRIDYLTAVLAGDQKKATEILTGGDEGGFNAPPREESERKSMKRDMLKYPNMSFPLTMPQEMRDEILKWNVVSQSPYSESFYDITNKGWENDPDTFLRVADHWAFESGGRIHAQTDVDVEPGSWTLAEHGPDGIYRVIKSVPRLDTDSTQFKENIERRRSEYEQKQRDTADRQERIRQAVSKAVDVEIPDSTAAPLKGAGYQRKALEKTKSDKRRSFLISSLFPKHIDEIWITRSSQRDVVSPEVFAIPIEKLEAALAAKEKVGADDTALNDLDIGRDYRYLNPSEFWAVSMTDAVSSRFRAKDSIWSRTLQWLREAIEHIKSVLGLDSTYPMLKALESIAKGDGSFVSREMLGSAQVYAAPRQQPIPAVGAAATPSPTRQTPAPLQGGISGSQSTWNQMPDSKIDDLIRVLQDKHIDTKRTVQAIRAAGRQVADKWDPHLQETLFHGRAAKRTLEFVETELTPLARDMAMRGLTLADLDQYLHARHAEEANALIAGRNPAIPDGGSGMTNQQARDYFANLDPSKLKRLEASAARVDAIIAKTRQTYVAYGLISQETADSWADMFDYYVPLMRDDKDGAMGIGQGFSIKGKEAKSRTGSTRAVVDILANIAMQREKAIVRGEKNRVDIALLGLAKFNPNADFWTVDRVPMITGYNEATGLVETHPDPNYKTRDNVIVGKVPDGKGGIQERAIVFNTENERAMEMVRALKNLDAPKLEGFLGFMAPITRYFASVNTQYNPVFGIANIVRDFQDAMLNLSSTEIAGHRLDVAKHTAGALIGIYQDIRNMRKGSPAISPYAQLWEDFQKQGGQTGYREMFRTSNDRAKAIERAIDPHKWMDSTLGQIFTAGGVLRVPMSVAQDKAGWLFDWLSDYNESLENAVRLSAYKVGLDHGMSAQRAAAMAKGLTVNFNRKGQIALQAGSLYAFFNASAQGTARIAETLFTMDGNDPKSIRLSLAGARIVAGGILFGSLQALMLAWAGFDDDEPPEFVRERNTVIPIGNKKYITIPMPLGFAILPNIGRIATEYALGGFKGAGKSVVKLAGIAADAFNPVGGNGTILQILSPTAIDPLVAIGENKDWTKKPIAKESMDRTVPGHKLWKDTASTPAKVAAEIINTLSGGTKHVAGGLSPTPDQIDYLIGQVTGGVGREASKLEQSIMATYRGEDLPAHKIPLIGRFYGNAADQTSQGATFYNNIRRINELEAEIKGLRKEGRGADAAKFIAENPEARLMMRANYAERQVQKLRKEKHDLVEKDAPRERIKALEDRIKVEMTRFNQAVKESKQRKKEAA